MAKKNKNRKVDAVTGAGIPNPSRRAINYNRVFSPMEESLRTIAKQARKSGNKKAELAATAAYMDLGPVDKTPSLYYLKDIDNIPLDKRTERAQDFISGLSDEQLNTIATTSGTSTLGDKLRFVKDMNLKPSQIRPAVSTYNLAKDQGLIKRDGGYLYADPKLEEYDLGGWLGDNAGGLLKTGLGVGAMLVPGLQGVGAGMLAGGIGDIAGNVSEDIAEKNMEGDLQKDRHLQTRMNNMPTAAHGGFISYTGADHDDPSGGIAVDKQGNPALITNNAPVAMTEDNEVAWFTPDEGSYIFSDELGFAKDAQKLINKYKLDKDDSLIKYDSKIDQAVQKQFDNLKIAQEMKKAKTGKTDNKPEFKKGGRLPKMQNGGYDPWETNRLLQGIDRFQTDFRSRSLKENIGRFAPIPERAISELIQSIPGKQPETTIDAMTGAPNQQINPNIPRTSREIPEDYTPQGQRTFGNDAITFSPNRRGMQTYNINSSVGLSEPTFDPLTPYTGSAGTSSNIQREPGLNPLDAYIPSPNEIDTKSLVGMDDVNVGNTGSDVDASGNSVRNLSPLGHGLSAVANIADYFSFKKRGEPESVGRVAPERVNFARDRLAMTEDAGTARRTGANTARNMGLNAGQTMANTMAANTGVDRLLGQSRSQSFEREENINAQLRQQAGMTNAELRVMDTQNKMAYQRELAARNPVANLSRVAANYFADNAGYRTMQEARLLENPNMYVDRDDNFWRWLSGSSDDKIGYKDIDTE